MALYDDIRARLSKLLQPQASAPQPTPATPGVQQVLQTKATGKVAQGVGPAVSTEAAQGAQASGQAQRQQSALAGPGSRRRPGPEGSRAALGRREGEPDLPAAPGNGITSQSGVPSRSSKNSHSGPYRGTVGIPGPPN